MKQKPKLKTKKFLDFSECAAFIEKKHCIYTRDYANSHAQYSEWCKSIGEKADGNSQDQFARYKAAVASGRVVERPYQDFWHWLTDAVCLQKGCEFTLEKDLADDAEPWQKEILLMYINEFGTGPYIADW